MLMTVSDWFLH